MFDSDEEVMQLYVREHVRIPIDLRRDDRIHNRQRIIGEAVQIFYK